MKLPLDSCYFFTFHWWNLNKKGQYLRNCYCVIEAESKAEAKIKMIKLRGLNWEEVYNWDEFEEIRDSDAMTEVSLESAKL